MNAVLSKEAEILRKLVQTNQNLRDQGVISISEYRRNARKIGERLVALMESEIEAI